MSLWFLAGSDHGLYAALSSERLERQDRMVEWDVEVNASPFYLPKWDASASKPLELPAAWKVLFRSAVNVTMPAGELGFEIVDSRPWSAARLLEPVAMLWIRLCVELGWGPGFASKVLKRANAASRP